MQTSANYPLDLKDAGRDRQQSQSPPDVYAARIERLTTAAAKWSEERRVQREKLHQRRIAG